MWRLRALHELATIELLDEAGTGRLLVMALWFLAENYALRRERGESERLLALAQAAAPGDAEVDGMVWAAARAMTALLDDDRPGAFDALAKGMAILPRQPQSPGHYRGMWPLLLAAEDDPRASDALAETRALGIDVNRINRGLLAIAEAILCGRSGDPVATTLVSSARSDLARYPVWRDLALPFAAEAALRDSWGGTPAAGWRRPPRGSPGTGSASSLRGARPWRRRPQSAGRVLASRPARSGACDVSSRAARRTMRQCPMTGPRGYHHDDGGP